MTEQANTEAAVLVVGGGPTGLAMASELARHGVACRVVDKAPARSEHSKALAVHARTLEIFEKIGIVDRFLSAGWKVHAINLYSGCNRLVRLTLDELDSPYPFALILPQSETERLLDEHLQTLGIQVERQVELTGFTQDSNAVTATLRRADGQEEACRTAFLVGCDGAHSIVRHSLGLPFEGTQYAEMFLLADLGMSLFEESDALHIFTSEKGLLAFFPIKADCWRVVANVEGAGDGGQRGEPTLEEIQQLVDERGPGGLSLQNPQWLAAFRIHRRGVKNHRDGRVFLAGDSAHIHSPAGGQGMNTGIQDALNLAWKLALVLKGVGQPLLLDSYQAERHAVAQAVLRGTDFLTRVNLSRNPITQALRTHLAPVLVAQEVVQQRLKRGVAELSINYRKSPVVSEHRGAVHPFPAPESEEPGIGDWFEFGNGPAAGDRGPDATLVEARGRAGKRLFEILRGTEHHLLLLGGVRATTPGYLALEEIGNMVLDKYGALIACHLIIAADSPPEDLNWSGSLLLDPDLTLHHHYGAGSECLYLIRPDGYIGFRSQPASWENLHDYLLKVFV